MRAMLGLLTAALISGAVVGDAHAQGLSLLLRNGTRLAEPALGAETITRLTETIPELGANPTAAELLAHPAIAGDDVARQLVEAAQRGELHPSTLALIGSKSPELKAVLSGPTSSMRVVSMLEGSCKPGTMCLTTIGEDISAAASKAALEAQIPDTPAIRALVERGQDHVLRFWPELSGAERQALLKQIESIDWARMDPLVESHVLGTPEQTIPEHIRPPRVFDRTPAPGEETLYQEAEATGEQLLKDGKVAVFTVAGGQASRLGINGPKGAVSVAPVGDASLFEIFAGQIKAARAKYGVDVPWYVMTSPGNHEETLQFFREHDFFGLPESDVVMFSQAQIPSFTQDGKLLLAGRDQIAMNPDGHGGSLKALVTSGALDDMKARGITQLSYHQVDNPLVQPLDPLFLGLHARTGSEMSTKVVPKIDPSEKVGMLVEADGRVQLIEYSEFPEELSQATNADGSLTYDAGNIGVHAFDVDFIDRFVAQGAGLPFRRANKAIAYVDEAGQIVKPDSPNAVKLEMFVFEALPEAENPLIMRVSRAEEFSAVKNASGSDTIETAKAAQSERAARWLEEAGVSVPRNADGTVAADIYVAPTFATTPEELAGRLDEIPPIEPGSKILLQ